MRDLSLLAIRDFQVILKNQENPVLFISDVQESNVRVVKDKSFITYICKMIELFKENNLLIIITEFGSSLGSTIYDILSLVSNYHKILKFEKEEPSAFSLIKQDLKTNNIKSIIIVGMEACYCCLVNSRILRSNDYEVYISFNGIENSNPKFFSMNKCIKDYREIGVKILE